MKIASAPQMTAAPLSTAGSPPAGIAPGEPHPGAGMPFPGPVRDGFDPPVKKPQVERPTLNRADRAAATRLKGALESPFNSVRANRGKANQPLAYDNQANVWRGPQGQPLVTVNLKNGISAYVDPAANKYYLSKDMLFPAVEGHQARLQAHGPLSLPPGTRFSPSQFSAADARALTQIANRPTRSKIGFASAGGGADLE